MERNFRAESSESEQDEPDEVKSSKFKASIRRIPWKSLNQNKKVVYNHENQTDKHFPFYSSSLFIFLIEWRAMAAKGPKLVIIYYITTMNSNDALKVEIREE